MTPDPLSLLISKALGDWLPQQPGVETISSRLSEVIRGEYLVLERAGAICHAAGPVAGERCMRGSVHSGFHDSGLLTWRETASGSSFFGVVEMER